jgi:hypothetical protein
VPAPSVVDPSMNVIIPVGDLAPLVVTVAVNVTKEPSIAGFALDANAVVVVAPFTVCVSTAEVLPA